VWKTKTYFDRTSEETFVADKSSYIIVLESGRADVVFRAETDFASDRVLQNDICHPVKDAGGNASLLW